MGRSLFGMMGLCVCFFLINTTMKVGCAEASGDIGTVLISYWPLLCPHPHYIHYTVPDVFRKISQWVSWAVIEKTKKSIKCAYLAKGFSNELYICNYASVSQRALFVILEFGKVWICGACLQLEQTASQLDDFWPINTLFFLRGWTQAINTKSTCYSITVHC